ncbi:MAG TPA: dephospho-CoA kinase [Candidatus Sulfopaludibacter sp.]|nr:dephospho-CoA kinase [Candidatus Sulfopaludibacter sp.]
MKLFGLTGGIGMGKSTAAEFLRRHGVRVVDTDELAHQLVEPGRPALAEIQAVFGISIVSADGQLRRDQLAQMVFADPDARKKLEAILHPRIRERWQAKIANWRRENRALAVVVIPLLFETNAGPDFDKTICVACSAVQQRKRLLERGWTPDQIRNRIAAQMPVAEKIVRSDFVIWTEGDVQNHSQQIERVLACLNR